MRDKLKQLFFKAEDLLAENRDKLAIKAYEAALLEAIKNNDEEFVALNYLAMAYDDLDNEKKAIETFRAAQAVAKNLYGAASLQYALALNNEGMVSCNRGKLKNSEPLLDASIALIDALSEVQLAELNQNDRSNIFQVYAGAADCKGKLGNLPVATLLMQKAFHFAKLAYPSGHSLRLQSAFELEALLNSVGRTAEANELRELELDCNEMGLEIMQAKMMAQNNISAMLGDDEPLWSLMSSLLGEENLENLVKITRPTATCHAYQLKISLKRVTPSTWRRIALPATAPLSTLHYVIQEAMGWDDCHLHEFRIDGNSFGDLEQMADTNDECDYSLGDFNFTVGSKFEYEYDFGDSWVHTVTVEKLLDQSAYEASPEFIAAKGACPPEDCGGPYGFSNLLQALQDPTIKRKSLPDWVLDYDPNALPACFPEKKAGAKKSKKIPEKTLSIVGRH